MFIECLLCARYYPGYLGHSRVKQGALPPWSQQSVTYYTLPVWGLGQVIAALRPVGGAGSLAGVAVASPLTHPDSTEGCKSVFNALEEGAEAG